MKVEEHAGSNANAVLAEMIGSTAFLGRVAAEWDGRAFPSRWQNLIGGWCVEHYRRHGKAPRKAIRSWFNRHAESADDREAAALSGFLEDLSRGREQGGKLSPDVAADLLAAEWTRTRIDRLIEELEAEKQLAPQKAVERIRAFREVQLGPDGWTDVLLDRPALAGVFCRERLEPLVTYPGALGRFFGDQLARNCFVAFMGPEGSTKSFFLLDVAWRAMRQRRRVAYFDVGDMTADQVDERFAVRAARHPLRSPTGKWPCTVERPSSFRIQADKDAEPDVQYEPLTFAGPLTEKRAWRAFERVQASLNSGESFWRRACHPSGTVSVAHLAARLQTWAADGWHADCVVIDYADLLLPLDRKPDVLEQTNQTWQALRRLSQEFHCLVVTATQSNRESYRAKVVKKEHTGGDKRKNAHVSGMFGISATEGESNKQICRLTWPKRRTGKISRTVHVVGCLDTAEVAVLSAFRDRG